MSLGAAHEAGMNDDLPANWWQNMAAGVAKAVGESPCERMDRYRRVHIRMGTPYSETLQRKVEAELHNEAEAAGTPCPCGRSFPSVVQD